MSLIDTFAATGAGAFSLSENTLYTTEAWRIFLSRLNEEGIFTLSRWYSPEHVGETGRGISLAVAALLESGNIDPSKHIAMVTSGRISTLLLSKRPLTSQDIAILKKTCSDLQFDLAIIPGTPPANEVLKSIVSARSLGELNAAVKKWPLNYKPPTDENPYFFNMLRLNHLAPILWLSPGLGRGNIIATFTLLGLILCLFLLTIATIIVPLKLRTRFEKSDRQEKAVLWSGAAYFSLIGAGFMFAEIALIQRLSVFLGHPVYALGILLFSMIASAGIGSLLSERLPLIRAPWVFLYPLVISFFIIAIRFILPFLGRNMVSSTMVLKILASISVIIPLGLLLGMAFPTGMRLVKSARGAETPWYWAMNGIFSVLCAALAVFVSIYFSISTSFYVASVCYIMLLVCLPHMYAERQKLRDSINR
jgi:hypothetical protein